MIISAKFTGSQSLAPLIHCTSLDNSIVLSKKSKSKPDCICGHLSQMLMRPKRTDGMMISALLLFAAPKQGLINASTHHPDHPPIPPHGGSCCCCLGENDPADTGGKISESGINRTSVELRWGSMIIFKTMYRDGH